MAAGRTTAAIIQSTPITPNRSTVSFGYKDGGSFWTKSGSVSAHGRQKAESEGKTMPGTGGKFPIRNLSDLANAKHDIGRTSEPRGKVVAWINRRARELGGSPVGGGKSARR